MKSCSSLCGALRPLPVLRLCAAALVLLAAGEGLAQNNPAYLNPGLPLKKRVEDLVGRMTLEEKVSQMQNDAVAIPRLQIPSYNWWNEGLHGIARAGHATLFPQAIGVAATWDTDLVHEIADAISTEARAIYNQAQREGNHSVFFGLTMWSPNINIVRDPRWGRGQETYGEDPFLSGQVGKAFVRGLQGDDPKYLKVVATPKHLAVHSGPESGRHTFNAVVSAHDLEDTYLPAFRELVAGAKADSVMCAYNSLDGSPACASSLLLRQKLRKEWHFDGYVVSDCGAITDVAVGHKFAPDLPGAAAVSVKAGTDLSCGKEYASLVSAVQQGLISEGEIDAAVKRLFTARFRLGMFDPPASVPFHSIPFSENNSEAHSKLALQAARASMVLLKNSNHALPLSPQLKNIAVIGPNAAALAALEGNYNATASDSITPLKALQRRFPGHVLYAQGSPYVEGFFVPLPETALHPSVDARENGLHAEYFADADLQAAPVFRRMDSRIDFNWHAASPAPGVPAGRFGVRWSGTFTAPASGKYAFGFAMARCSTCDDEETIRVWLDERLVYDFKHARTHGRHAPTTPFELEFADTNAHPIRIEYTHDAPLFGAGLTFNWKAPIDPLREQAVALAAKADVVIVFLGLSPNLEGEETPIHVPGFEGGDRTAIELPAVQQKLVEDLAATGKPLIIVLMNGSALALRDAEQRASAILEAWYPGQSGGTAIAETLFGENNPAGRLPITFYAGTEQLPAFSDYAMQNRTYRYFEGRPLYPFGYGLSYASFSYSGLKLSPATVRAGKPLNVSASVHNTSTIAGDEVVELYLVPRGISPAPLRQLVAFERMHLQPGESRDVHFTLDARRLSIVDAEGVRRVRPGSYELYVGGGPPEDSAGQRTSFRIVGTSVLTN